MGLVHLLSPARVVANVARKDGLHLVGLKVMPGHFAHSSLDGLLANLALPQMAWTTPDKHLICKKDVIGLSSLAMNMFGYS